MMKKKLTIAMFIVTALTLSSCELAEEGKSYSLKFKLDGVQKEFKTDGDSGFYYDPVEGSWVCNWYNGDEEICIYFNQTPTVGSPFDNLFTFSYTTAEGDLFWNTDGFTITITQWGENEGDIQQGTFSGPLNNEQNIIDGTFEADYTGNW